MHAPGNERLQPGGDLARFDPRDNREAALVNTLPAGSYSATVESANGQPGVGIVEVYRVNWSRHVMPKPTPAPDVQRLVITIRGQRVMLDTTLARLYGVETFRFNEAIKRNTDRFPEDFCFRLSHEEVESLTSQIAMSKIGRGGRRTLP